MLFVGNLTVQMYVLNKKKTKKKNKNKKYPPKPTTSENIEWNSFGRGILLPVGHSINFSHLLEDADEPAFPAPCRLKGFQFWQCFLIIFI